MSKKILVTGGAGFIGSNLVDFLLFNNNEVIVIDDLSSGKIEYINEKAKFYKADICNNNEISDIFAKENFDYVFHLAAQIDVRKSVQDPEFDNKINVLGGLNILKNCHNYGVKKIIFSSTGGALYSEDDVPANEKMIPRPVSPYGIHKLTFEKYLYYFHKVFGVDYISLRFANIYGPRQYKGGESGVISIFVDNAVSGKECKINGEGKQTRDFVYVDDVVKSFLMAMESDYVGEINISSGEELNILELVELIKKKSENRVTVKYGPAMKGEVMRSCLDNTFAKKILKWQPTIKIEEGIEKTIKWAINNYKI